MQLERDTALLDHAALLYLAALLDHAPLQIGTNYSIILIQIGSNIDTLVELQTAYQHSLLSDITTKNSIRAAL